MVNLIETFFGMAVVSFLVALCLFAFRRRRVAVRLALWGFALGAIAGTMELYLRL